MLNLNEDETFENTKMEWVFSRRAETDIKTHLFDKQYLKQFKYRKYLPTAQKNVSSNEERHGVEFAFPHNNNWIWIK